MDLYLLRHGETIHNTEKKYSTEENPLSPKGRAQAKAMGQALAKLEDFKIEKILLSPTTRTRETGEIVNRILKKEVQSYDGLTEIDAGAFKGLTFNEGARLYPEETSAYLDDFIYTGLPGGESVYQAYQRAQDFLKKAKKIDLDILTISHGGLISLILAFIKDDLENYYKYNVSNASLSKITYQDGWQIDFVNKAPEDL